MRVLIKFCLRRLLTIEGGSNPISSFSVKGFSLLLLLGGAFCMGTILHGVKPWELFVMCLPPWSIPKGHRVLPVRLSSQSQKHKSLEPLQEVCSVLLESLDGWGWSAADSEVSPRQSCGMQKADLAPSRSSLAGTFLAASEMPADTSFPSPVKAKSDQEIRGVLPQDPDMTPSSFSPCPLCSEREIFKGVA